LTPMLMANKSWTLRFCCRESNPAAVVISKAY
jgi:hypothetical protein